MRIVLVEIGGVLDFDGSFGIGSGYHISGHMRTDSGFEIWGGGEGRRKFRI